MTLDQLVVILEASADAILKRNEEIQTLNHQVSELMQIVSSKDRENESLKSELRGTQKLYAETCRLLKNQPADPPIEKTPE